MAEVTVSFVTPSKGNEKIVIELDEDMNRDSSGSVKKVFRYGETAYFRAYSSTPDKLKAVSSDGSITEHGLGTATRESEFISFINSNEAETSIPIRSLVSSQWLGNSLGKVNRVGAYGISSEKEPQAEGTNGVALLEVAYTAEYKKFGITLPKRSRDEYPVLIYVYTE
jgi:hypothetical protein